MPHAYQNSRRKIEQTIGLEAMRLVFFCGAFGACRDETLKIKALFDEAIDEVDIHGSQKERMKQRKRTVTLVQDVMVKPFVENGEPASKFGLSVYYLLRNLIELGMLKIDEHSRADEAMQMGLTVLSNYTTKEHSGMDQYAFNAAQGMLERLQTAGYFRGADWIIEYEDINNQSN